MKAVIIIPARYGSTRYPGKPLVELRTRKGKKSLIQLSWEAANKVSGVLEIYVATVSYTHLTLPTTPYV